ncbi:MAG TPA: hypothetical protein VKV04_12255 [Verrucomicrobiae bacterium]|nr:hypothetical protein [Verrucomicrobiae bacterium]
MDLPSEPALTFAQEAIEAPDTLGTQLRKRRLELKLCIFEAAPILGVSAPTLGLWELDRAFPKRRYHSQVAAFLGRDPFP